MLQAMKSKIIPMVIGVFGAIGLFQTLSIPMGNGKEAIAYSNSFFSVWFCILSALLYKKVYCNCLQKKGKEFLVGGLFSMALSFALTVGKQLETVENLEITKPGIWMNIIILTLYFSPFVCASWDWIIHIWEKEEKTAEVKQRGSRKFFVHWGIIFFCWIPVFLAFYPGAFVYDACDEYIQVATRTFTTHHPLTHVLLLGGFVCAGNAFFDSFNLGIAMYTLCQMLFLSGVFAYTISVIKRKVNCKYLVWGMIGFYGLFPVIPMYAVCSSKDTIFTGAFLVVVIKMLQLLEDGDAFLKKKGNISVTVMASVLMMLFRNNGFYAYVVWIFVIFAGSFFIKKDKKNLVKMGLIMLASVVIFLGATKILTIATKAQKGGSQEIMTVPIQQMVRTYLYSPDTYTEEEKELLFEMIPEEEMHLYNPRLSDLVKSKFQNENFGENKGEYLKLWLKIGSRKPMIYFNAWLMTSYGYWYPDAVINVYGGNAVHTFTYEESSYFGFETEYPGVRESKFPWLEEQYRKMSLELYQQKVPGVSMLFSPGFLFWMFLFCLGYFIQNKTWDKVLGFTGILLLWLTAILGPTYLVRYVLILWFALPVMAAETKIKT